MVKLRKPFEKLKKENFKIQLNKFNFLQKTVEDLDKIMVYFATILDSSKILPEKQMNKNPKIIDDS